MNFLRKIAAVLLTCLLFTGLAVISVVASIVILVLGIAMMVWVKYNSNPARFTAQRYRTDVIDGEYRVIETTQVIEQKEPAEKI